MMFFLLFYPSQCGDMMIVCKYESGHIMCYAQHQVRLLVLNYFCRLREPRFPVVLAFGFLTVYISVSNKKNKRNTKLFSSLFSSCFTKFYSPPYCILCKGIFVVSGCYMTAKMVEQNGAWQTRKFAKLEY